MQVYVAGNGFRLDKRHFVGRGGEGSVYAKGDTAYKIYTDPTKMIPVAKIQELQEITDDRVVKPKDVITDKRGTAVGYTMSFVSGGYALCQLFPRAFRERESLDIPAITHLVCKMQEGVTAVHAARVLLVDLNEMNFRVSDDFGNVFFIDTDSYQTPNYPATALMESVRDRQMRDPRAFNQGTDWFAFGVVTYQLFCGIHPYKGKHQVKGLDARMQANISVFNSDVRIPKAAYPVAVVPDRYREWYRAVFEDGVRAAPPTDTGAVVVLVPDVRTISGTDALDIVLLKEYASPVRGVWDFQQHVTVATEKGVELDQRNVPGADPQLVGVAYSPRRNKAVAVSKRGPFDYKLYNLTDREEIPFAFTPTDGMAYDGRVYLKGRDKVFGLLLTDAGNKVVASSRLAVNVLERATQLYPGVVVQNLLGSMHVAVFPRSGETRQIRVQELDEYQIVDARFDRGVLMVVGNKNGVYDRLVFRFGEDYKHYDLRIVGDITPSGLNFVVLDSGVVVCLNEDDALEVFRSDTTSASVQYVEDPVLGGDMTLARKNGQLVFYRENKLYRMSMKPKR